jgi:hypothetical protein
MVVVTIVILVERLVPAPQRVARVAGLAIAVVGILTITRL